jgi:AraC family transcriptional regulator, regulatory protein of adaptative response / methylated-DNA-[protein]-cysteine methyltransferase
MEKIIKYNIINTPVGEMILAECDNKLCLLEFLDREPLKKRLAPLEKFYGAKSIPEDTPFLKKAAIQLESYFKGKLKTFDLPLDFAGTSFQKTVWNRLLEIPYGQTVNYGFIASKIGKPEASRAVGRANGSNPISIIVPCHRVIGKDGSLVGYGGKMWRKKWLLEHEGALQKNADLI